MGIDNIWRWHVVKGPNRRRQREHSDGGESLAFKNVSGKERREDKQLKNSWAEVAGIMWLLCYPVLSHSQRCLGILEPWHKCWGGGRGGRRSYQLTMLLNIYFLRRDQSGAALWPSHIDCDSSYSKQDLLKVSIFLPRCEAVHLYWPAHLYNMTHLFISWTSRLYCFSLDFCLFVGK